MWTTTISNSSISDHLSSRFSASRTNGPRSLSRVKAGTHSAFGERSHTAAHTAKHGTFPPPATARLCASSEFFLFRHAFIYIHFPVLCEPSPSADGENLAKLPSQTLSQTVSHPDFQLLPQMAHGRFCRRKRVHTRLCSKDRTQGLTRRNTGISDGGGITTLGAFHTFRKPCVARG